MFTNCANVNATAHKIGGDCYGARHIAYADVKLKEPHQIPAPQCTRVEWHAQIHWQCPR